MKLRQQLAKQKSAGFFFKFESYMWKMMKHI